MSLREYRNEETFTQENLLNLGRSRKSLWHLNHKPPLSQFNMMDVLVRVCADKN